MTFSIITLQPAPRTDQITEDGTELQQRPYPFHVRSLDGWVESQDFWRGRPQRVVGFAARLDRQQIDLWWRDAVKDPQQAVGMYVVTRNSDGSMDVHMTAIESVVVRSLGST